MIVHRYLPAFDGLDGQAFFARQFGPRVFVENDGRTCVTGERLAGAGRHSGTFMVVHPGHGVGGGLFLDHRLYRGAHRNAGPIGSFFPMDAPRPPGQDLLETLRRQGFDMSDVDAFDTITPDMQPVVDRWCERVGGQLAPALRHVADLLDPAFFVIGGRLPAAILWDRGRHRLSRCTARRTPGRCPAGGTRLDAGRDRGGVDAGAGPSAPLNLPSRGDDADRRRHGRRLASRRYRRQSAPFRTIGANGFVPGRLPPTDRRPCRTAVASPDRHPHIMPMQATSSKTAILYRMVMPDHVCPFGRRALDLLRRRGFVVEDRHLTTRAEVDAFKAGHGVKTTPQTFIEGVRIGGHDDLRRHFGLKVRDPGATTYAPVAAIFGMAAAIALAASHAAFGSALTPQAGEWFVGVAMCLLALQKLRDVEGFANGFLNYDLLAQRYVPYAWVYPWAEGLAGVLMIAGALLWIAVPVALCIGTIGAVSVVKAVYVDRRTLKCACVGGNSNVPLGFLSLTENLLMVAMGLWMLVR